MNFRCHKVYLTQHSYPRYVEDATLAQRPRTSCSSSMDVSRGLPMPLGLATARPRGDVRHIFIFTTYLATSNISHFERHISDRATYLGSSDISCAERHISLRATYLRERRHTDEVRHICRSERHKSRATYVDVLRHMSLVRDRRRYSRSVSRNISRLRITAPLETALRGAAACGPAPSPPRPAHTQLSLSTVHKVITTYGQRYRKRAVNNIMLLYHGSWLAGIDETSLSVCGAILPTGSAAVLLHFSASRLVATHGRARNNQLPRVRSCMEDPQGGECCHVHP